MNPISKSFLLSAVAATTVGFSFQVVLAYTPSIPSFVQKNTIDISSVLAETEAALKIANAEDDWECISSMMRDQKVVPPQMQVPQKIQHRPTPPTSDPMDIINVLAEAEAALQAAGIQHELDVVTDLLAESIEETKSVTKRLASKRSKGLSSSAWDATNAIAVNTGKAIVSFTLEQLKEGSEVSKFSQAVARKLKKQLSTVDFTQLGKAHEERMQQLLSDMLKNHNFVHNDLLSLVDPSKAESIFSLNENIASWQQRLKAFVRDAFQSPFAKVWDDRASCVDGNEVVSSMEKAENFTNPPNSLYFMTEKKQLAIAIPSVQEKTFDAPSFEAGRMHSKSSFTVALAKQFVKAWVQYTNKILKLSSTLRSAYARGTFVETNFELLETEYSSRLAMVMSKTTRSVSEENFGPLQAESIPYFARVQTDDH
ncbi:hypothetical protein IV203_004278 [Nitzschia inconspicua]|uniref:Uncharacterized protein n=1 Tax=Nitzschia inconspicua TaxID=303405 RepID=A0A9K3L413_9STRA|nr:hypothetical protein IV203_004278 [Nitzschia inconspicua]